MSEQEIAEIFKDLEDVSPLRRSKALEELRVSVKENGGHLLFGNVKRVFSLLKAQLRDSNWNVAHQSIQFLGDLFRIQDLGPDCKSCLSIILPTLVDFVGIDDSPYEFEGISLRASLLGEGRSREYVFSAQGPLRSVSDGRYHLIYELENESVKLFD